MKNDSGGRSLLWGALGLGIVCCAAVLWFGDEPVAAEQRASEAKSAQNPTSNASPEKQARSQPARSTKPGTIGLRPEDVPGASYAEALKMFREYSKYPPNSRPVDETYQDIAAPALIAAAPQALMKEDLRGKPIAAGVFCSLQPAIQNVSSNHDQEVTLSCWRGQERGNPSATAEPLVIHNVSLDWVSDNSPLKLPSGGIGFVDDGSKGDEVSQDGRYTLKFPITGERTGLVSMAVQVSLANREVGDPADPQSLSASFSISPAAPAHFTGQLSDELRNGSLIVRAEVAVQQAGRYRVFANLEHEGELLAYAKEDLDLEPGKQEVELLFFGKILHESGAEGTYNVTHLRGHRFNLEPDNEGPMNEPLQTIVQAHVTAHYQANDFSAEEWTSDYKTERIEELAALAQGEGKSP